MSILKLFLKDTDDWSNDAENTAAHHRNKLRYNRLTKMYFEF